MADQRRMHIGVYAMGTGNHIAGWRHPGASTSGEDLDNFIQIAQICEAAKLDFVFTGDTPACQLDDHPGSMLRFEPAILMTALAQHTSRLGLIATASTSYTAPYHVARQFASVDRISGGRAGWNVVTTSSVAAAANFGGGEHPGHELRYEIAAEHVEVVLGLWDSWEDGARILNRETGEYYDRSKVHTLDHKGKHFSVKGPLNQSRTPQGRPVIVQAGSSATGQNFAAQYAEVMFTVQHDLSEAKAFYAGMKQQMQRFGRQPGDCKIMPGLFPIVGATVEEARAKLSQLMEYTGSANAMELMSLRVGHDMSKYDLDGPIPELTASETIQSYARVLFAKARRENQTLRDVYNNIAVARGYLVTCGTAVTIADMMEEWLAEGAADGFILMPAHFPGSLNEFAEHVIPELRRRGLFRVEYEGVTLRENLGLQVPRNRYAAG
jgi:FMN-dependent oxidoreductase (nitrilotriacetate monooxygenase family)